MSNENIDSIAKELKNHEKFVVFVRPGLITYGLSTKEARMKELRSRIRGRELSRVRRPLYGMMLLSLVNREVIKMVQMEATDVYRDYWFAELQNGRLLYIEEVEEGLQISMVCGNDRVGFEDFAQII